jgi:hypothetical protein
VPENPLGVPLARPLTTPDMWRMFTEADLAALDATGRTARKMGCSTRSPSARDRPGWNLPFCARIAERRGECVQAAALVRA